ncbi:porin [Janthinobacterium fluminis]|uniref:Porin n=1 Tax=Janthinobacterium fluminis TaxID=2987524 RepID=A0ABT5JX75_9BURK|nr:porin [Janthinobacterium fluminis]MDC8757322.1 porin [Janthinobacterium fluminis]
MKTSLLAAAILSTFAGAAAAQSSVGIYGAFDLGLASISGGKASTHTPSAALPAFKPNEVKLRDGILQGSRLGFRGTENLGDGLAAVFVLEAGILTDTGASDQGGLLFGRQAYVGLKSDAAGSVTLGRQYAPHYLAFKAIDPMDDGFAGAASNLIPTNGKRINNALKYATPSVSGFGAELLYGLGEVAGNSSAARSIGAALGYQNGPLLVKLAYHSANNGDASDKAKSALIGATYDFGAVKAHAAYGSNKGTGTADNRDLLLGLTVPMGAHTLLASYIRKDDKSSANRDASQFALAYTYALSKRTALYTSLARVGNDNGATFRTASAGAPAGGQIGAAGGTRELNVGMRHLF